MKSKNNNNTQKQQQQQQQQQKPEKIKTWTHNISQERKKKRIEMFWCTVIIAGKERKDISWVKGVLGRIILARREEEEQRNVFDAE